MLNFVNTLWTNYLILCVENLFEVHHPIRPALVSTVTKLLWHRQSIEKNNNVYILQHVR